MFERIAVKILKKIIAIVPEKCIVWSLKQVIAIALKDWHLHRDPVKKQKGKEEVTNDVG